jgi:hypothetical protein
MPSAFADVLREEAETAGEEAYGRWGEAIDVLAVQAIALQLWCGEQGG